MKKSLLLLVAIIATATAWSQDFTPLQYGVENEFVIESDDGLYLSFTPTETDYYVISTTCTLWHYMAFNLWSDSLFYANSELDALQQTHISNCGYPNKLYAGRTYIMRLGFNEEFTTSVTAQVMIRKGYLVSVDPESADLSSVLYSLPVVAYEGQEVKLTVSPGVTITSLTASSGGELVAISVDDSGMVYTFTMPAADVIISGSYEMPTLQLGDNVIDLNAEGSQYAFVPEESGAYVFSMNCGAEAQAYIMLNNNLVTMGYAPEAETLMMGAMLEANATYYVIPMIREGVVEGAIMNITKRELPRIKVGENAIDVPYGATFDYPFIPPVSGDYTFYTTGDADIYPDVYLYLGDYQMGSYYNGQTELNFTVTMEAGVPYTIKAMAHPDYPVMSTMHLTVVSPPLPSYAITLPTSFEHGTVTCDKETATVDETVTLTVKPDNGYELETLTIVTVDANTSDGAPAMAPRRANVDYTQGDNGTYTFDMPNAPVNVNATFKKTKVTGIDDIDAVQPRSGQRYNLMGQPVGKDYRGIVIEDGKKLIVK